MNRLILEIARLPILHRGAVFRAIKAERGPNVAAYVKNCTLRIMAGDTPELAENRARHRRRETLRRAAMAERRAMRVIWGEAAA